MPNSFLCFQETRDPDAAAPCPKIFFGTQKELFCGNQAVQLSQHTTLEETLVMCLCVYYVRGLSYPAAYGQTLGLVQTAIVKEDKFPVAFMTERLRKLLSKFEKAMILVAT